MIKKPTIIITSLGRTGTKFFSSLFGDIVPANVSMHEPDVFNVIKNQAVDQNFKHIVEQIREAGVSNLIIRKSLGQWNLVKISDARVKGQLEYAEAVRRVLKQRKSFVNSQDGRVYIESNVGYYGLIDILTDVYLYHRVIYLVRDGREWVRSHMDWGEMYGKSAVRRLFAHTWPEATEIKGDAYRLKWKTMSRFEKICWAWVRLNDYSLRCVQKNPSAKVFRFEDIFQSPDRYKHLEDLVRFATTFHDGKTVHTSSVDGWLDKQINKSFNRFPSWGEWSVQQRQHFDIICGPLMKTLGYIREQ